MARTRFLQCVLFAITLCLTTGCPDRSAATDFEFANAELDLIMVDLKVGGIEKGHPIVKREAMLVYFSISGAENIHSASRNFEYVASRAGYVPYSSKFVAHQGVVGLYFCRKHGGYRYLAWIPQNPQRVSVEIATSGYTGKSDLCRGKAPAIEDHQGPSLE